MPALRWTEGVARKENCRQIAAPSNFGQFRRFTALPSGERCPSEILMPGMGRLGGRIGLGRHHPVTDLRARAAERMPHCPSFLPFKFRGDFTPTRISRGPRLPLCTLSPPLSKRKVTPPPFVSCEICTYVRRGVRERKEPPLRSFEYMIFGMWS